MGTELHFWKIRTVLQMKHQLTCLARAVIIVVAVFMSKHD